MNILRCQALADGLRRVPPERFDMAAYWDSGRGCTIGHAARMPEFKILGFTWRCDSPLFAFMKFFGFTEEQAVSITHESLHLTPNEVADKIERWIYHAQVAHTQKKLIKDTVTSAVSPGAMPGPLA